MTEQRAEKIANILIGVAAAGAAYYILKTPSLRRLVWGLTRNLAAGGGPAWLAAETKRAWADSRNAATQPTGI